MCKRDIAIGFVFGLIVLVVFWEAYRFAQCHVVDGSILHCLTVL